MHISDILLVKSPLKAVGISIGWTVTFKRSNFFLLPFQLGGHRLKLDITVGSGVSHASPHCVYPQSTEEFDKALPHSVMCKKLKLEVCWNEAFHSFIRDSLAAAKQKSFPVFLCSFLTASASQPLSVASQEAYWLCNPWNIKTNWHALDAWGRHGGHVRF